MKNFLIITFLCLSLFAFENEDILKNKYQKGNDNAGFKLAENYFKEKKYLLAGDIFIDLTLKNDIRSYSYLGEMSAVGLGIKKDCSKGAMFLFSGMKEGDCRSIKVISDMFHRGICVKLSEEKRNKYLDKYKQCLSKKDSYR
jgi:TPR repeat protein